MVLRLLSALQLVGIELFSERHLSSSLSNFTRALHAGGNVPLGMPDVDVAHDTGGVRVLHESKAYRIYTEQQRRARTAIVGDPLIGLDTARLVPLTC